MTLAVPRTAAVLRFITVLRAKDPAPTNDTGSEPIRLSPDPVERAPLTPTAQARTMPPTTVSTATSPAVLVTVACSIAAVTRAPTALTDPAAPAAIVAAVEAGIATWPATAVRLVSSRAVTVTPTLAATVDRFASMPVMAAEIVRPVRSLNTSAVERAFSPESTPAAAIVRMSARSAAVTTTRPDSATAASVPAVTLADAIDAVTSPLTVVTSTAAPAESDERSLVNAVVAIEPATARILSSLVAVTSTEPAVATTSESSAIVAVRCTSRLVTFTEAATVSVESDATAPTANDQTPAAFASGIFSWLKIGSSADQAASAGLPLVARTRTFPLGTVTRDREIVAVPRVVEFTTVTAAPMLVESVPLPSRFKTKPPDAVTRSMAVVASTETSPVAPIVTVEPVIVASTVGSTLATATNPDTLDPALLPLE